LKVEGGDVRPGGAVFNFAICFLAPLRAGFLPLGSAQGRLFAICHAFFPRAAVCQREKRRRRRGPAYPRACALGYIMSPLRGFPTAFRRFPAAFRRLLQTAFCRLPTAFHGGFVPDFRRARSFVFKQIGGFVF